MRRMVLIAFVAALSAGAPAADRPNVLLILVDDLKPAIGAYGDAMAKTPAMDSLAARGLRFEMAYCNHAICASSRFNLMLGSHTTSTGLYNLGNQLREAVPAAVTMPQHFARHGGYRTESLGKVFHVGHGNEGDPGSFCVPDFKDLVIEYLDPASTGGGQLTREEALFTNQRLGEIKTLPRGAAFEAPDVDDDAYADGRVAAETIRRLQAAQQRRAKDGTPFFIAVGFVRPHLPFSAPKKYWDLYDPSALPMPVRAELPDGAPAVAGKRGGEIAAYEPVPEKGEIGPDLARQLIHGYYASVSYTDAQVGRVVGELDRLGLTDSTIVVLWGDNGFHLGDLGIWTKHTNYEQATRIPLIFAGPGIALPGGSTRQLAGTVDVFPTLAELAGLPTPRGPQRIDGVSLLPVLRNPDARVRDHVFHCYPKKKLGRAIRTERYRMVEWKGADEPAEAAEIELYDYEADPHETRNLALERPEIVEEHRRILSAYPPAIDPSSVSGTAPAAADASPLIANRPWTVTAEVTGADPHGVVVAQGGKQHGYALHFIEGGAVFDVRIDGRVTRVKAGIVRQRSLRLEASLNAHQMSLKVNDEPPVVVPSPGLIPAQPKDPFSIGLDVLSAAGDYDTPNAFNGHVVNSRVIDGSPPAALARAMDPADIAAGLNAHNRAVFAKEGWIRDPFIATGPDGWFYLTGTTPNPGDPREMGDPFNTGLGAASIVGWQAQVWRSRDLIAWESLGAPYTLLDGVWVDDAPGANRSSVSYLTGTDTWFLWAPELHWTGDRWALVHTSPSPVKGANLSLSAGSDLAGPWVNPMGRAIGQKHDPSLFRDDDGVWWLVWGATTIAPLKPDFSGFAGDPVEIRPAGAVDKMGHEGCIILKIHGKYVLFGTGWSTGKIRRGSYNLYYATADRVTGPYSERMFAGRFLGHGTPFRDRDGRWWCTAFYNANVPPLPREGIETRDLRETAQTINLRGTTLVPLDIRRLDNGDVWIRAKDLAYATPGPDEAQAFDDGQVE